MDRRPPGSSVHGIIPSRILELVAISSSRGSSWPRDQTCITSISCTAGGFFTTEPSGNPSFVLCVCSVTQSCPTLCDLMDSSLPDYSIHGILQARILEWVAFSFSRECSQPRSPTLQADSSLGKPMNTGVGSLFLLQRIFLTQESNPGFLHCWQILYQLSHQGRWGL